MRNTLKRSAKSHRNLYYSAKCSDILNTHASDSSRWKIVTWDDGVNWCIRLKPYNNSYGTPKYTLLVSIQRANPLEQLCVRVCVRACVRVSVTSPLAHRAERFSFAPGFSVRLYTIAAGCLSSPIFDAIVIDVDGKNEESFHFKTNFIANQWHIMQEIIEKTDISMRKVDWNRSLIQNEQNTSRDSQSGIQLRWQWFSNCVAMQDSTCEECQTSKNISQHLQLLKPSWKKNGILGESRNSV